MPIYEYVCDACEACFEEIVSPSASAPAHCPRCESPKTRRVLSRPAHCVKSTLPFPTPGAPTGGCGGKGFS
jgi:putative FmdB family regulatory protein